MNPLLRNGKPVIRNGRPLLVDPSDPDPCCCTPQQGGVDCCNCCGGCFDTYAIAWEGLHFRRNFGTAYECILNLYGTMTRGGSIYGPDACAYFGVMDSGQVTVLTQPVVGDVCPSGLIVTVGWSLPGLAPILNIICGDVGETVTEITVEVGMGQAPDSDSSGFGCASAFWQNFNLWLSSINGLSFVTAAVAACPSDYPAGILTAPLPSTINNIDILSWGELTIT